MMRIGALLALFLIAIVAASGCGASDAGQPGESEWEIEISGPGGTWTVSIEQIREIEPTGLELEHRDELRRYTGARLSSVLQLVGIESAAEVSFEAEDGYTASLTGEAALSDNTILAYQLNEQDLDDEKNAPVMVVTTEDSPQTWVGRVKKVTVR